MNSNDRYMLDFLMSMSDEEFDLWAVSVPNEDIEYAMVLIRKARIELDEQEDALVDEDLTLANEVLAQFRL
jgi:hypothetical protein